MYEDVSVNLVVSRYLCLSVCLSLCLSVSLSVCPVSVCQKCFLPALMMLIFIKVASLHVCV